MKKINKNGFTKIELMTVLGLLAILIAFGAKMAVDSGKNYKGFKTVAVNFLNSVALYKDKYTKDSNIYYLYELVEKGYSEELKNPVNPQEYCDQYETYADATLPNNKTIVLVCGEYVVEGSQNNGFKVFEVTEWSEEKKEGDNDSFVVYNYREDGELVFPEYYPESTFLQKYFQKNKYAVSTPFAIKDKLDTKMVYRKKTLVKDLK